MQRSILFFKTKGRKQSADNQRLTPITKAGQLEGIFSKGVPAGKMPSNLHREKKAIKQSLEEQPNFNSSDEIYISNAGLVLLWVFLQRFFEIQGLLEGKSFRDFEAQSRAVRLLQFLADGEEEEAPEFLLPLNKILCGMPLDEAPHPQPPLTKEEREACEEVLTAAIESAPIMGKVSFDGLRHSFLLREGVLRKQSGYWLLRVEKETHDIVLGRLPWPFNFIKLPWMGSSVQVEW